MRTRTKLFLLPFLLALLLPQSAMADNIEQTYLYMVTQMGQDQLNFEMPVYDIEGYNSWVDDGKVYVTPEGGSRETLLYYRSWDQDGDWGDATLSKGMDGLLILHRVRGWSDVVITTSNQNLGIPFETGKDYGKLYLSWKVPEKYRGKKLTISWYVHKTGNMTEPSMTVDIEPTVVSFPAVPEMVKPSVMNPIVSFDPLHAGQMMLTYTIGSNNVQSLTAEYTEVNGVQETGHTMQLEPNMSGFVYLDASKCYKNFTLKAIITDTEGVTRSTASDPITLPTLQQPVGLSASLQPDGSVVLTWRKSHSKWQDIQDGDMWDVQRNVTGALNAEGKWTTIDQVSLTSDSIYTCTDQGFLDSYQGKTVYYRVRRSSTTPWNWYEGNYAQSMMSSVIKLNGISSANVKRGIWEEGRHFANFTFAFGGPQYDSEGRFVLRSAQDWETLAKLINSGEKTEMNVIMAADIDLGDSQTKLGVSGHPYCGEFNGNGHVLTVHYNETSGGYAAPFAYLGNKATTISNLQVTGTIFTTAKFAGGFIGEVMKDVTIKNSRSSVAITSKVEGDASAGGFVGRGRAGVITLTDCLFDGEFHDSEAVGFGGLVGWSETAPVVTNCLVSPTELDIDPSYKLCMTFVRSRNSATITNSYFTTSMNGTETYTENGKTYMILRNSRDWNTFLQKIVEAKGSAASVNAIMMNDFEITEPAGYRNDAPYRGNFNGNGHTLTVTIDGGENEYMAPFVHVGSVVISNLNVRGTVKGGNYSSGLIGSFDSVGEIRYCHVSTDVHTTGTHAAGFIGYSHVNQARVLDCMFDGSITTDVFKDSYAGAFIGWDDGNTNNYCLRCFEDGTYTGFNYMGMNYNKKGSAWSHESSWTTHDWSGCSKALGLLPDELVAKLGSNNWTTYGSTVVPKQIQISLDQEGDATALALSELAKKLGGQWQVSGNLVIPGVTVSADNQHAPTVWDPKAKLVLYTDKSADGKVLYTERRELTESERVSGKLNFELVTSCVDHDFRFVVEKSASKLEPVDTLGTVVTKAETGEEARYEFNSNVEITELETVTQQSSVVLNWKTTGTGDFYRIIRRDKATDEEVVLEENATQTTYIDKTPRAQHVYIYTVEGVNNCEGQHVSSMSKEGQCEPTGMVRGYIRLTDGTALAGVVVVAEPQGDTVGEVKKDTTDASGFFEIKGLSYQGSGTYLITAESTGEEAAFTHFYANFSEDCNLVTNANLTQNKYYQLSGYVMYEGTSVPVVGAQFERDGKIVYNGSGKPITTDSQGNFTLSIPQGTHMVRAVKDGHVFLYDGYFTDPEAADTLKHNWQKSIDGHVFWDQTKVMLQGRVAGGSIQGDKPLGELASVNNLGDSLTIVMQLEGDNASWLVRDQLNASITELHNDYYFGTNLLDTCHADVYRHRLVVKPSPVTGEYCVPMLPVKYKVTEVYAQGYTTLFQAGKVGETLDLSAYTQGDTATYSRIYHSSPTLDVKQLNMKNEDYLGIKTYTDKDNTGKEYKIELWNDSTGYSFDHPVFMEGSPILMMLSATEHYYYNNNARLSQPDIVHLSGGEVRINNALVSNDDASTVPLDSLGEGSYTFTPQNLTFTEEGDMALKTLSMTLLYDGTYYDVLPMDGSPIRGYVMAVKAKPQGKRATTLGGTYLIDILRDPPGAGSSARIESGSKFNYTFSFDAKVQVGVNLGIGESKGNMNLWQGIFSGIGGGNWWGKNVSVNKTTNFTFSIVTTYAGSWQYGYSFETNEAISTSSSVGSIGRDGDVFIGMTQSAIMQEAVAVRAVSADTYDLLTTHAGGTFSVDGVQFKVPQGTMKLLAEGKDSQGNKVYLIRDEVQQLYTELQSTFAHSQSFIEKERIPELFNIRNTLLLPLGTDEATAKAIANTKGYAMYISKVDEEDNNFGLFNYYTQVNPDGINCKDSIAYINQEISTWVGFLALNEKEKLEATDLVKRYEVDGKAGISYSESFGTSESDTRYWQIPLAQGSANSFNIGGKTFGGGKVREDEMGVQDTKQNEYTLDFDIFGEGGTLEIKPIFSIDWNYKYGMSESHSKKISFTLSPGTSSNLVVDVYHTQMDKTSLDKCIEEMKEDGYDNPEDYFFQYITDDYINYVRGKTDLDNEGGGFMSFLSYLPNSPAQYRSLVYRTRGGATCRPYEDERKTIYYQPGTVLDEKTIAIDNPRIWTDQASVSNVPFDEPARFTIYLANESEIPALATTVLPFNVYLDDSSNPKGAKILMEGHPLTGGGQDIYTTQGQVVTKVVEIYPTKDYDYEDITLCFYDPQDVKRVSSVKLSAHFVPAAGKVNISLPGDKWVVNTESQYDNEKQQYYMPVRIDGFDVNYLNFDHIELQYKLSTQGEKDWVNICSYYESDSLMAKASGVCKLIEDNGYIMGTFWGESDPIEQQYDIRAVNYCRYGNGFLTRSSNVLTGIKDTRRPQLFGSPEPSDGILGIGENIMLRFSEPIAGNYLRDLNNFQVLGQTNTTNISLSTDLRFDVGDGAESMSSRNLSAKSFTVDVMLYPDKNNKEMIFFTHGEGNERLELGVTGNHNLMARFVSYQIRNENKTEKFISREPVAFNNLHQVEYVIISDPDAQTTTVIFYDGSKEIGTFTLPRLYGGTGRYYLGTRKAGNLLSPHAYQGEMLEFRLWNRALSVGEMDDYRQKRLTGYELGLMDNYPLSEGAGEYSYNRTNNGGDLKIVRGTWKVPDGIAMKLDGQKGFHIESQKFERADYHDYTLMFWFRTDDNEGTLLSNGPAKDEAGYKDHFNFGVHEGMLNLWLGGSKQSTEVKVNDSQWHHVALTVSRSRNVGNLFIDKSLKKTFAVDTLGGIHGNNLAAGATYVDANTAENAINGYIDEIGMYEMALSENIIKTTATTTPTGEEMGLLAHLNFGRYEVQLDNQQRLMPTGISLKRYYDAATGEFTAVCDTLVSQATVDLLADKMYHAPMHDQPTLENIKYSYVAKDNEMFINLDVPASAIEKTNVMVTVKDVADLNGNVMASPAIMDIYVYRNPLRWNIKQLTKTIHYNEESSFEAVVQNLSGRNKRFTIEGLPVWITASLYEGEVGPLGEVPVTFTISPYTNIGDFDEIIYIMGEDGLNEPLPVTLKIRGEKPDWTVDEALLQTNITMSIVGQVTIGDGNVAHDPEDMLAVFDSNHRLMGVTHLHANPSGTGIDGLAYLTVYNTNYAATPLHFEFFDASSGTIHQVLPQLESATTFKNDTVIGTATNPVIFTEGDGVIQAIPLQKGWNWVSFNVQPDKVPVKQLLNNATMWKVGDALETDNSDGSHYLISYKVVPNPKDPYSVDYVWDNSDDILSLNPCLMYRFYSTDDKLAYIAGKRFTDPIVVHKGWNRIGYSASINLPLGTALAEYTDQASPGDIIKSQNEFATLTEDAMGNRTWKGTLEFLRVGEGYMLKRNAEGEAKFSYPQYVGGSHYNLATHARQQAPFANVSGTSMTVVAVADGVSVQPGDRLTVYRGAEVCGIVEADAQSMFYLSIGDVNTATTNLTFMLERDGELIAATSKAQMAFVADAALGTPDEPTAISFTAADNFDADGWYSLSGLKLAKKPQQRGVYIHNNEKVIIK